MALALTQLGDRHPYTTYGAWGYVGLRVVHSLYQALFNNVVCNQYCPSFRLSFDPSVPILDDSLCALQHELRYPDCLECQVSHLQKFVLQLFLTITP